MTRGTLKWQRDENRHSYRSYTGKRCRYIVGRFRINHTLGAWWLLDNNTNYHSFFEKLREAKKAAQEIVDGQRGRCQYCGQSVLNYGDGTSTECAGCWQVTRYLGDFMQTPQGRVYVRNALRAAELKEQGSTS